MSDSRYRYPASIAVTMVATLGLGQAAPSAGTGSGKNSATVAVRGVSGIKGAKLTNLEKALQLQHTPPPPPAANANTASLLKGPPGPPPEEPPPPTDERQLLEEVPPDVLGGS
jgi:hypothetical protein